jgi:hypothetical protein
MFSERNDRLNALFLIESFELLLIARVDSVAWWGVMSARVPIKRRKSSRGDFYGE